ncbi:tetratricopeptide repeat protein [Mesonia sp. MT50]|uniref:Tetratricopeptide repeat protein n=1 Tax=Mesonia profundi TaxID=3070998 RepID=A0ABU0ZWU0_9FLAO|nr:tetratricopeptide repeat protein [Mesonia profundi]MDQ7915952.1 tetratricopeptide repeat protein [Mesonia profundi]
MLKVVSFLIIVFIMPRVGAQTSTLAMADSLYAVGDYQKAIHLYEKQDSLSASVYQKIASAEQARGDLNKALIAYEKSIQQNPKLVVAKANYGKLLRLTYQYKKADSVYTELIQQYPQNPDFQYQLGLIKEKLKNPRAYQFFEKAIQQDATHQNALYELASYHYQNKAFKETENLTQKALTSAPKNIKMQLLSALNAYSQRDYSSALKRYQKVIQLGYTSESVWKKLGMCYYQEAFITKAIEAYQHVLKFNAENASAHLYIGKLYLHKEKLEDAERYLLMALLLSKPKLDENYQSLGLAYKGKQEYKKTMHYFKLALEEDPKKMRSQFELAVAADNYYADLQTRLNYYALFLNKFEEEPKASIFIKLSKRRISDLKKEIHLSKKAD